MKKSLIISAISFSLLPIVSFAFDFSEDFKQEIIETHNAFRAKHHAPALQWDNELANYAYRHASQCNFAHTHGPYGENLAAGYATPEDALTAWYNEQQYYSYSNPHFSMSTGHFTQLVWKSTTKVGCALVPCNGSRGTPGQYIVCEYSPAGNMIAPGYFSQNVLPALPAQAMND